MKLESWTLLCELFSIYIVDKWTKTLIEIMGIFTKERYS